jgi:hypothetical protein
MVALARVAGSGGDERNPEKFSASTKVVLLLSTLPRGEPLLQVELQH